MTPSLMVQGCTSDAGKSVFVAGLCRLLARKNIKVAPFKPQNMALNSAVTIDHGEIGRAQAVQAQACYLPPHTDMNPVLLKPSSDTGAQVIIQGSAVDTLQAKAYHDYKRVAMNAVLDSYHRLTTQYECIITEGAGSPAEINLRDNDIANMGFAEKVDCPVILIADIDRGGVFAHIYGTLKLLSESEQNRVAGFIINRFRGDIELLKPGLHWLEQKTGKPVFGVLPYLKEFYLDAEDAVSSHQQINANKQCLQILVPVLPRISNHTDFDALRLNPDVNLQFVAPGSPMPEADLIILPGSKNVRADLATLREHGWDKSILRHLRFGGKVLGICGGYQMLGDSINDPLGIEDKAGSSQGLQLLNISTELKAHKQLTRTRGKLLLNSHQPTDTDKEACFEGYEIHCGITQSQEASAFLQFDSGKLDGAIDKDDQIAGTYIHGLFDHHRAASKILEWAGLKKNDAIDLNQVREEQLNRLANCLESNLSDSFYEIFPEHIRNRLDHPSDDHEKVRDSRNEQAS